MSHSITTTASYVLSKYSRSYPSALSPSSQTPSESEWQHFTNPVMRINLEAKRSPSGQLVSMRLRILWSIHTDASDLYIDQREVIFEDLELLSFSSLPTIPVQSDHSLPLKAVYRDAVVGIRYLHPRTLPLGSQSTYRRFQITFKDAPDTSRFINAIKSVCPCKASPHSTQLNSHGTMLSRSLPLAATTVSGIAPVAESTGHPSIAPAPAPADSGPLVPSAVPYQPPKNLSTISLSSMAASLSSDDSAFVTCSDMSRRSETRMGHRRDRVPNSNKRGRCDAIPSSLPSSSQPSSSDQSMAMPPPPVPQRVTHSVDPMPQDPPGTVSTGDERSQLLASLSKHPSLYELSRIDLETVVTQVIREEGFLHLLESLDSLWSVKGLLNR